ncbi:MAG TPA: hypothetical protein VGR14_05680 [Verrucomicrobiae bacterium]|jgi:hypothetical protein|nr:hypothetical protein [Verrucomicrobiae bacterium]
MKKLAATKKKARIDDNTNAALQQALNQPGIKVAMEIAQSAEKHAMVASQYEAYLNWDKFAVTSNSCNTVGDPS